ALGVAPKYTDEVFVVVHWQLPHAHHSPSAVAWLQGASAWRNGGRHLFPSVKPFFILSAYWISDSKGILMRKLHLILGIISKSSFGHTSPLQAWVLQTIQGIQKFDRRTVALHISCTKLPGLVGTRIKACEGVPMAPIFDFDSLHGNPFLGLVLLQCESLGVGIGIPKLGYGSQVTFHGFDAVSSHPGNPRELEDEGHYWSSR
ncbi:hypothetical protein AMTR_s00047p00096140, partial [Amborella trichopoda]